ncbi:uncharacterized protein [Palaemon carinicauda]|uniref:uncharacterized protein n=1 Tax=Palaemon carinicauda TaxID=392227 RepID=UPI0035B5992A
MITVSLSLLLLLTGMGLAQTTESYDGDYTEWELVGDLINGTLNDTAGPLEDSQDFLDAEDPPVFSDEMCLKILQSLDEQQHMEKTEGTPDDDKLDQPSGFIYGNRLRPYGYLNGNRYRPYYNGPYGSYGRCLRTGRYGGYSGRLCYGRRRVYYGAYTYCCQPRYLRPFVLRRGRYVRCRCY